MTNMAIQQLSKDRAIPRGVVRSTTHHHENACDETRVGIDIVKVPAQREASGPLDKPGAPSTSAQSPSYCPYNGVSSGVTVSRPSDPWERAADCAADHIMRSIDHSCGDRGTWMPAPDISTRTAPLVVSRKCTCGGSSGQEDICEECAASPSVRRLAVSQGDPLSAPAIVGDVLRSSGRPLDPSVRRFMEARFGYDFAGVRIHTDTQAAESAAAVGAQAYTYGNNIVFADGQYLPHSRSGRQLLAHELAHSIQQTQRGGQVTAVARLIQRQASAPGKTSTAGVRRGTTFVTRFHPGVAHNHKPTGRWADVQADAAKRCASASAELQKADPKKMPTLVETAGIECSCAHLPPSLVAKLARETVMLGLPLAQRHLDHYIDGSGSPLVEDLQAVLEQDTKLRAKLAAAMRRSKTGHIKIEQRDYGVKDFQYAFGAIDRLDFEVDSMSGQAHVWFQDRYEWHPVGFGYTSLPGDSRRDTNCVHAAMVELKSSGAQDYWMIGDAVVSLSAITPAPAGP